MTAARKLDAHTATLLTATVEIKTLTVSGRQVTQAVFRQLQEQPLVTSDGCDWFGVPWGRVNYHPEAKWCGQFEHHHVVWQAGDELRRATVIRPRYTYEPQVDDDDLAKRYLDIAFAYDQGWRPKDLTADYMRVDMHVPGVPGPSSLRISAEAKTVLRAEQKAINEQSYADRYPLTDDSSPWVARYHNDAAKAAETRDSAQQAFRDRVTEMLGHPPEENDVICAADRVSAVLREEVRRRAREAEMFSAIGALPQLFIAV